MILFSILNQQIDITGKQLQNTIAEQNELSIPFPDIEDDIEDLEVRREEVRKQVERMTVDSKSNKISDKIQEEITKTVGS